MSKVVLIICFVALGISAISLVVSTIRLAYWDVKRREEYKIWRRTRNDRENL